MLKRVKGAERHTGSFVIEDGAFLHIEPGSPEPWIQFSGWNTPDFELAHNRIAAKAPQIRAIAEHLIGLADELEGG